MIPVFANSAWVPARERMILRGGRWETVRLRVRYGLAIHPHEGPVLIDTGYTPDSLRGDDRSRALRFYGKALRPALDEGGQPGPVLARFGLTPKDVRHVVVTHFHADHVSGLTLFPNARFIASDEAWARAKARSSLQNLRHGIFTELFPPDFESRLDGVSSKPRADPGGGLPPGTDIFGDGSAIAIDLPGHADGQFGVLFKSDARPLLYAVDAQWLMAAVTENRTPGFPARLLTEDFPAMQATSAMLRKFVASGGDMLLCHDPAQTAYDLASGAGSA